MGMSMSKSYAIVSAAALSDGKGAHRQPLVCCYRRQTSWSRRSHLSWRNTISKVALCHSPGTRWHGSAFWIHHSLAALTRGNNRATLRLCSFTFNWNNSDVSFIQPLGGLDELACAQCTGQATEWKYNVCFSEDRIEAALSDRKVTLPCKLTGYSPTHITM